MFEVECGKRRVAAMQRILCQIGAECKAATDERFYLRRVF